MSGRRRRTTVPPPVWARFEVWWLVGVCVGLVAALMLATF